MSGSCVLCFGEFVTNPAQNANIFAHIQTSTVRSNDVVIPPWDLSRQLYCLCSAWTSTAHKNGICRG